MAIAAATVEKLRRLAERLVPGGQLISCRSLAPDAAGDDATHKAAGYGKPIRLQVRGSDGRELGFVMRTANSDDFGHDRRADRAANQILAWDTFGTIPRHVRPVEIGALCGERMVPLDDLGELYLVTEWAPGAPYADDLRRVAGEGAAAALDGARCDALADYLVALHRERGGRDAVYRRSLRDLVGSGEGIFGIVDGYPADTPGAPPARLQAIERAALGWRWRLRGRGERLARIHGDFHPFNVLFGAGTDLTVLDASRGCRGDPADDVTCMAVNYLFFALARPPAARAALARLWRRFLERYLDGGGDRGVLEAAAPFFAWRCLVVCCPRFYPDLDAASRDRLLALAERALAADRLEPAWGEELLR